MRTEWILASLAVAAIGGAIVGCPGELDESKFSTTCTDAPKDVFAASCVSGCHSAANAPSAGGLDLESPGLAARLVGKTAKGGAGLLIDPTDVDKSVLLTKMKASPPFGARMPFGAPALSDDKIQCVRDWIADQTGPVDAGGETGADTGETGTTDAPGD